jgi:hypothetical protein
VHRRILKVHRCQSRPQRSSVLRRLGGAGWTRIPRRGESWCQGARNLGAAGLRFRWLAHRQQSWSTKRNKICGCGSQARTGRPPARSGPTTPKLIDPRWLRFDPTNGT